MNKILLVILCLICINFTTIFAFSGVSNIAKVQSISEIVKKQNLAANFLATKGFIKQATDYRLSDNITRKEAIKIVVNVAFLKVDNKCEGVFKDVADDWGCKYIESAYRAGFIKKSDKFRPDDSITKSEVLKLVFKARNLDKKYTTENWQQDYVASAFDLGIISELFTDYSSNASRGWIFLTVGNTFSEFKDMKIVDDTKVYTDEIKVK